MTKSELKKLIPDASKELCSILANLSGAVPAPIRAEIFGSERFGQHGRSLGETHRAERATWKTANFFPRLKSNIRALREAHEYIGAQASTGYDISPAAEWLLDNFHLIESQLEEIYEGLPRSYFRTLPILMDEPLAGLPRVYGVAWAFVAHTDSAFDEELAVKFLGSYQEIRELKLSEMWALPTTLRVVLIENLRRLAERVAANKAAREAANLCFDHVETYSVQEFDQLRELFRSRGVDRVFLAQMSQRLQDRRATGEVIHQTVCGDWLRRALPDLAAFQIQQVADQAADNLSVSNAVTSLRALADANWSDIVARTSVMMGLMLTSSVFESEHVVTRDQTLHEIELLARSGGLDEAFVVQTLIRLMQSPKNDDIGMTVASHWLSGAGRPVLLRALDLRESGAQVWSALLRRMAMPLYLTAVIGGTVGLVAWMLLAQSPRPIDSISLGWLGLLTALLMLVPASEAVVAVINRLISESARPEHLPRLSLVNGIPLANRVLVVIPAMLVHRASAKDLVRRLELHYLANPELHAQFALLTDWVDADTVHLDSDAALLAGARQEIRELNERHPFTKDDAQATGSAPRFIMLHRERLFSETEQRWIGWERKRGKLELLVSMLATGSSSAFLDLGSESDVAIQTKYILTLDSDTQLPPGRLRELVGVAAHPHNQPHFDAGGRCVVRGYGIFQPRVATPLPAPNEVTLYHWLFAGQCGIDPYSAASSEVYQDLFSEGTFTGKGLLNVQAMQAVLSGRLPEGQVLSHDLLEGSMARCAVVTDISVIEDAPFHADVAASRVHRWTRGDWQLLPFLFHPVHYGIGVVNCWKMFDNLRRSLVAPASLAFILLSLTTKAISPWAALGLVIAAFSAGPLMGAVAGFLPSRDNVAKLHFFRQASIDLVRALMGGLWLLGQLLEQAQMAVDAIVRSMYRMTISRRHLLQWTTAASAQASAKTGWLALVKQHWKTPLVALLLLFSLLVLETPYRVLSFTLCLLWAASATGIWWVSKPNPDSQEAALSPQQQTGLEEVARDTWRFFERCVGAADNHLPPDNLQTMPHDMLAHRTSPTNIGLYLLSVSCARQFGWIGTQDLLTRMEATLATLLTLQRHRGHFANWYDTQTCAALLPVYVSTVDSGNLSGHLIAVAQACLELARAPQDRAAMQHALQLSRNRLVPLLARRCTLSSAKRDELKWCLVDHRATLRSAKLDEGAFAPNHLSGSGEATRRLKILAHNFEALAWQADFSFLYHRKRHLLHIGYRVAEQQLDASFYDLLASESRLTSLLAIAKGDVPVRHWASLGRPAYAIGSKVGLRSWSGSMFEYLMPALVLHEPHGSVLRNACQAAIEEQIAFARTQDVPWGISESAYAGSDHTLAYQYAPQGVPRLALRRTPPDELVIAPYATALAAQLEPLRAYGNFGALQALSSRGRYGYIEALDFSPARQVGSDAFTPVATYMAHHQGMTIVALANVLLDGLAQRWGMANAHIEAVASLLHERAPREVSMLCVTPSRPLARLLQRRRAPRLLREVIPGATSVEPTHVLSNGRYSVSIRANGAGWSRWGQMGITRWRDDALRDAYGSFFYLRRNPHQSPVSITQHPAPDPDAHYQSTYHADRVCLEAIWPELKTQTTIWVSPEDDIEFRMVELQNLTDQFMELELMSAFEVTLTDPRADEAHPAFTSLFVRAKWLATHQALLFERTPRLPAEPALQVAHFLAHTNAQIVKVQVNADRQRWRGRNHGASNPLANFESTGAIAADSPGGLDTGLDPVSALAVHLRIGPNEKIQLTFATAASDHSGTLNAVIDKYRQHSHVQRASLMSATLTGIRLRELRIGAENFAAVQILTTALVLSLTRPPTESVRSEGELSKVCDRRLLWRFGISGDRPLILVSVSDPHGMGLLRTLAQALRIWSWGGIVCDLVILNAEPASYLMILHREINALRERHVAQCNLQNGAGATGMFLLRAEEVSGDELTTLQKLARVRLNADGRAFSHHVQEWNDHHEQAFEKREQTSTALVFLANGPFNAVPPSVGEFDAASGEFGFRVDANLRPVRPWINVLANPKFGAHISESGGGYTWAVNSRLNQLTAWSNDPVADPAAEWFLIQDRRTNKVWSVSPAADSGDDVAYRVSHGQGYSVISHRRGNIEVTATWCVDVDTSVKHVQVIVTNRGRKSANLRVIAIAEWMMGSNRSDRSTVHTARHSQNLVLSDGAIVQLDEKKPKKLTALLATQCDLAAGFGGGAAFLATTCRVDDAEDWTCDRRECFDARGRLVMPDHFGQNSGNGLDPCAALSTRVVLAAGDRIECIFLLGYAESADAARTLAIVSAMKPAAARESQVREKWNALLGACTVKTPDPLFDAMVNRWLLYQAVGCRMWAKSAFYQAGGATGFRDQLQDAMALTWAAPDMLRQQITLCASRQFMEGDVQHWWHAPGGAGVRTHFSDDLLWLPYAAQHYVRATGDKTLLNQSIPFIDGIPIPDGAEDAYYTPNASTNSASVYEHCARAIDRSLSVGVHGLPLMGSGDWNDGMNRVGIEGRGESVWLGWFLCQLVDKFLPLAQERGDDERVRSWEAAAHGWKRALNGPAWDGRWFMRAFFDDGQALGSGANSEARIDLIAQAWSVLSNVASVAQKGMALNSVEEMLVDHDAGLIRLLYPPFAHALPNAGYIQAYPPGVRENGGQYTHAGVWALMAQAELARNFATSSDGGDAAYRYFTYLSPAHRASHPVHGAVYGVEPYVVAADVYSHPPYVGRGGWSWYTGAAAWLHRAAIESIFGLCQESKTLSFTPCFPSHWQQAELSLVRGGRTMRFIFVRATASVALQSTAQHSAQLLNYGQPLLWNELKPFSCFVIPLALEGHVSGVADRAIHAHA
jgi:cyclic beta-1,2-glucan synthetase